MLDPIGEDPEPEEERSYTEPMYEIENVGIELAVNDSTIEIPKEPETIIEELKEPEITKLAEVAEPVAAEEIIVDSELIQEEPIYFDVFTEEETYYQEEEFPSLLDFTINEGEEEIVELVPELELETDYLTEIEEEDILPILEPEDEEEYEDSQEPSGGLRSEIVALAESYVGVTPYVAAGRSLTEGTDCSGFINLIYDSYGIYASPGSDDYQYEYEHIEYEDLQPGDIVVYRDGGHVGIYAGDDTIIHCSNPEDGTIESDMWYSEPTAYVSLID